MNRKEVAEMNRVKWLESMEVNERDYSLLDRCSKVLVDNIVKGSDNSWGNFCGICPSPREYKGVWNWDTAFHGVGLSNFDIDLAYEQFEIFFACQKDNGMYPDVIYESGKVVDNFSKPPVFPWAFTEVYKRKKNPEMLKKAYESYKANERFWVENRLDKKYRLFHYDCKPNDPEYETHVKYESGMDNSPRWDNKTSDILAVDLNAFMVMLYDAMIYMADELGNNDSSVWKSRRDELCGNIDKTLWNEAEGIYVDVDRTDGSFSDVITASSFVPLFAGFVSEERAEMIFKCASDTEKFYPGMPTVSYDSEKYSSYDYWRGPTWLNYVYFAVEGLKKYGYCKTAGEICETVLNWVYDEKTDVYEYYDSKNGKGLGAIHFGWTAAFVLELAGK